MFSRIFRGSRSEALALLRAALIEERGSVLQSARGMAIPIGFGRVWCVGWTRVVHSQED